MKIPANIINLLKRKKLLESFDYRDVWKQEHLNSFTVAKSMKYDILTDIHDALTEALHAGTTFQQFRKDIMPMLQKKGWWGYSLMPDPKTGEIRKVLLGTPRRLETIYKTNMRTVRAAGQWDRIESTKKTHPYLLYQLGPSREHRIDHKKWRDLLLSVGHSFWDTHYPPNGWG